MKSRDYVKETFSWQHYYWVLTDEGVEYLQKQLNLPDSVRPKTLISKNANEGIMGGGRGGRGRGRGGGWGGRGRGRGFRSRGGNFGNNAGTQ